MSMDSKTVIHEWIEWFYNFQLFSCLVWNSGGVGGGPKEDNRFEYYTLWQSHLITPQIPVSYLASWHRSACCVDYLTLMLEMNYCISPDTLQCNNIVPVQDLSHSVEVVSSTIVDLNCNRIVIAAQTWKIVQSMGVQSNQIHPQNKFFIYPYTPTRCRLL